MQWYHSGREYIENEGVLRRTSCRGSTFHGVYLASVMSSEEELTTECPGVFLRWAVKRSHRINSFSFSIIQSALFVCWELCASGERETDMKWSLTSRCSWSNTRDSYMRSWLQFWDMREDVETGKEHHVNGRGRH